MLIMGVRWKKHGHTTGKRGESKSSSIYSTWAHIIQRCTNPNDEKYHRYGNRGIKVSKDWLEFTGFLKDMGPTHKEGLTIDRIDNDGNYCKENCRWVTKQEQNRNYSKNLNFTYKGKTQCLKDWATELDKKYATVYWRIKNGRSFKEAFDL